VSERVSEQVSEPAQEQVSEPAQEQVSEPAQEQVSEPASCRTGVGRTPSSGFSEPATARRR